MTTKTTKTNTLHVDCFTTEVEREMTNSELAEYFRGIAEMFDRQEGNKYGFNDCIVKFSMNFK